MWMSLWRDRRGQDLIEYALVAGFVAVTAGALLPGVSTSISTVFSKVTSVTASAARQPQSAGASTPPPNSDPAPPSTRP